MKAQRKYPGSFRSDLTPQRLAFLHCVSGVLGGRFEFAPFFKTKDRTHAFLAGSATKLGVLLESQEVPGDDEGIFENDVVFLSNQYFPDAVLHAEMRCHSWDGQLAAVQSGDDSILKGSAASRSQMRDQRSLEYAAGHDRFTISCVRTADAPESYLGVTWKDIDKELGKYGTRISKALPSCLSLCLVPSEKTRVNQVHVSEGGEEVTTKEVEVPDHFRVFLVNSSPLLLTHVEVTMGAYGTVDDEHWQRPATSMRCFIEPGHATQIDVLDVGDLDFMNWYEVEISPPITGSRTLSASVNGHLLSAERYRDVPILSQSAYELQLEEQQTN